MDEARRIIPPARLQYFGAEPTDAQVTLLERPRRWRTTQGILALAIGIGITPVVAIVPPHVPWALTSLIAGIVIARNRFNERFTLLEVRGRCPGCDRDFVREPVTRLKQPQSVVCPHCGELLLVEMDVPGEAG